MRSIFIFFAAAITAFLSTGCDTCKRKVISSLLDDFDKGIVINESDIELRQMTPGLSCFDSSVFALNDHYEGLRGDFKGMSGNKDYGNYLAVVFVVSDEEAFAGLVDGGCVDGFDTDFQLDWDTQKLVVLTVASNSGCNEEFTTELGEDEDGAPYLMLDVSYDPKEETGCEFNIGRSIVLDTPKDIQVSLDLRAGCLE